ncbi:hypothetical protein [Pseudomonas sp. ES3-33]|uniref:hypothetical protein n=1 Tax=Pseudomonas sp. ES3-33 TaxID=1628833 RepID=UPI0005DC88EB|nr:hypothetical protein [Pseudomonas sp. ES3-33]KJH75597.1 hypothetical protein UB23_17915 [Pseudomonas sp. ES3-33]
MPNEKPVWFQGVHDGRTNDRSGADAHTKNMNDITREEFNARIELQQLKVDARLKEFEGKVTDGLTQMNHSLQLLDKDLAGVRGIKGTIVLNSILSVIAIVGIVIAVMAYGVANFDSGRDTSAALQDMKQQSAETRLLLEQIKAQQTSKQ